MTLEEANKLPIGALLSNGYDYFLVMSFRLGGWYPITEGVSINYGETVTHIVWEHCKRIA